MAGLVATALMTAGTYGAGALPATTSAHGLNPHGGPFSGSWPYWLGLTGWLAGLIILAVVWWRLGELLHRAGTTVSLRWLLVTGALWATPLLVAPPMGSRDVYAYACQGALWLDGVDPYTVGVAAGGCPWTDSVPSLWRDTSTPYGPLAIALAGAVVALARLAVTPPAGQLLVAILLFRALALVGALLVAWYLPRLARACGGSPLAATWLALLSPLTAVHVLGGAHNDALMVGLVVAALALAAGRAPTRSAVPAPLATGPAPLATGPALLATWPTLLAAGVVIGLAVAIKLTAVVAVPFVALLAVVRAHRPGMPAAAGKRVLAGAVASGATMLAGAVAFTSATVATGLDLGWLGGLSHTGRMVQWTSLPTGLGMAVGYLLRLVGQPGAFDAAVAVARALGLGVLMAASVHLVIRAWRATGGPPVAARRGVLTAGGLAFGAATLFSPVFYPWYALATVTVLAAAVADQRWRRPLAAVVLAISFLVLPNGLGLAVRTKLPGALLDVALVTALAVFAVRRGRRTVDGSVPSREVDATPDSQYPRSVPAARRDAPARSRGRG